LTTPIPQQDQRLAALRELRKREQLSVYKDDFALFAKEQIKVLPKDARQGFQPFVLNDAQQYVNTEIERQRKDTGMVRAIILKSRQQGISTYATARVYWLSYFNSHNKSVVMAHDGPTADALFTMSRNVIDNMTPEFKPSFKKSNAKEIMFEHNDSGYRLFTAGSPEAGRGMTPTIAHLSEVAFWPHDEKILAGLYNGISQSPGTEVIMESTANGMGNEFHRLWLGAVEGTNEYLPIFIPWFKTIEYRRKAPEGFETGPDEKILKVRFDVDDDQLYWRRLKIGEGGPVKFQQEYPSTWQEAFLVSGANVFNLEKLSTLVPQPILAKREFNMESKMFDDNRHGNIEVYKYPKTEEAYALGADVALGVGKDSSAVVVMNAKKEVCAVFRDNLIDPSAFGDLIFYLGRYYNNALAAVESNSMGIATLNRLSQLRYTNLYSQTKAANVSKEEGTRLGWRTTSSSKPMIIGFLKSAIENDEVWIPSKTMINELMSYTADNSGKTNASAGSNDDTVIALAIAVEVIRTHADRMVTTNVTFAQKMGQFKEVNTTWL